MAEFSLICGINSGFLLFLLLKLRISAYLLLTLHLLLLTFILLFCLYLLYAALTSLTSADIAVLSMPLRIG